MSKTMMPKKKFILILSLLLCTVILPPGTFIVLRQYLTPPSYSEYYCCRMGVQSSGEKAIPVKKRISTPAREALLNSIRGELLKLRTRFIPRKAKLLPDSFLIKTLTHSYQTFNNCGPASLSMLLSGFGITASQEKIRESLRPDKEDRHTSIGDLARYARGLGLYVAEGTGGDSRLVKELVSAGIPVILKIGLDPENDAWMCHYIVVVGYSDEESRFILMDSLYGPYFSYSYETADIFWAHFQWTYLVIVPPEKGELVAGIIGQDPAFSRPEAGLKLRVYDAVLASPQEAFAWYNLGRLLLDLGRKLEAETAMQTARDLGLPWRMPWYDFSLYQVYLSNSRHDALLELTGLVLARNPYSEETRYYRARALLAQGKTNSALAELDRALEVNPYYSPVITLLEEIRKSD